MKKTYLNLIKLLAFTFVIFAGFVISNNQNTFAERTFNEPRVADWRSASMIRVEYGTDAKVRTENEGDIEFFFDPAKSVELNKVVFRERKNDLYLIYEQDATTGYIEGTFEGEPVRKQAINETQNYIASTIQDSDGELCGITKTTNCQPGGEDRDFYNGPAPDITKYTESLKAIQEKEEALSQCENNKGIPLQFITCPLLDGINNTVGALIGGDEQRDSARGGLLIDFLKLPPINAGQTGSILSQVVGNVVNIANIFYILIFIILIFASSIPFLNLDSYTIKKTLPKFIAAVILTQFSIQICGIIVDFFNLLGLAIPNVIFGLISGVSFPPGGGVAEVGAQVGTSVALVAGAGALVGVVAFAPVIIIILAIMALVAALTAVFYIMVRFFLLYVMIIISPLAFAAWVLPGTEKFFKQWWTNFIKLNAMFVTIMGLLSISILLSLIFRSLGSEGGNTVTTLLAGVIPIIALILVPKTLKWTTQGMNALAAGALNAVGGAGNKAAKAGKQQVKKGEEPFKNRVAATNFGANTRLGRGLVAGAGGFFNTKGARRNIANRANKVRNERAAQVQYDYNNFSAGTRTNQGMKADESEAQYTNRRAKELVKRTGSDTYSRQALMGVAAQTGDTATLRALQSEMTEQQWTAGVNANYSAFDGAAQYRTYDASYAQRDSIDLEDRNPDTMVGTGTYSQDNVHGLRSGDLMNMSGGVQRELANSAGADHLNPQAFIDASADSSGRSRIGIELRQRMRQNSEYVLQNTAAGSEAANQAQAILDRIDAQGNWV